VQEQEVEKVPPARADQIKPVSDWIFVEQDPEEAITPGGIHRPAGSMDVFAPAHGRVVAAGPGRTLPSGAFAPMDLAPGARVVFMRKVHRDHVYPFEILGDSKNYWFVRRGSAELLAIEEA
jgi:chaperonin GroES